MHIETRDGSNRFLICFGMWFRARQEQRVEDVAVEGVYVERLGEKPIIFGDVVPNRGL